MISTIGVIGAGQMGVGIAQVSAQAGFRVLLTDLDLETAENGKANVAKAVKRLVEREKMTEADGVSLLANIIPIDGNRPLKDADLVIEAATEREDVKRRIFEGIRNILRDDAILASNTSSIPITRMAQAAPDARRFIGIHFFNPVPVMGLIEVIRGLATSDDTVEKVRGFCTALKKEIVFAEDEPGFVVNRILLPMINEAVFVLGQGTANIGDIDKGCRIGLNHPMGPLELADFVGLDTCLDIVKVLYNTTGDSKYRPAPLLVKYVEAGWLGRKTGRGFYDYSSTVPVPTR